MYGTLGVNLSKEGLEHRTLLKHSTFPDQDHGLRVRQEPLTSGSATAFIDLDLSTDNWSGCMSRSGVSALLAEGRERDNLSASLFTEN